MVELVLYVLFFFPGILALVIAGWRLRHRVDAHPRGQRQQPGRRADLAAEDDDSGRRRADRAAGLRRGAALRACACATASWPARLHDVEELEKQILRAACGAQGRAAATGSARDERSGSRPGDAGHPGLHDHDRLPGRLHADGAGRGLRLLRLLPAAPGLLRQPRLLPAHAEHLHGAEQRRAGVDPAVPADGLPGRARQHPRQPVQEPADRAEARSRRRWRWPRWPPARCSPPRPASSARWSR